MPYDPHGDDASDEGREPANRRQDEFDCPSCNANNPHGERFGDGDEVRCAYCGQDFLVRVSESGRLRLIER